jgi:hypothetical protein
VEEFLLITSFGLTQFFMLIGLVGTLVPVFPSFLVMWLAALGYGVATDFGTLGIIVFILITLLAIGGMLVDNVLMGAGARVGGASWKSIAVGWIAGIAGTLLWPPIGGLIAAPLAILVFEYTRLRDWKLAWRAVTGMATGFGLSFLARLGIGVLIMLLWWLWVWKG